MAGHGAPDAWVPDACTLPTAEQPLRVAEFDELFRTAVRGWTRTHSTALELAIAADAEASARALSEREARCCSFFTFDFDRTGDRVVMRIAVPDAHIGVLDALQARLAAMTVSEKDIHGR